MKKIFASLFLATFLMFSVGCIPALTNTTGSTTSTQAPPASTASITYEQAQKTYLNAWSSYHTTWLALPETDPRKAQWTKDYHPKFLDAATLLVAWSQAPNSASSAKDTNAAIDEITAILMKLAIPLSGGK